MHPLEILDRQRKAEGRRKFGTASAGLALLVAFVWAISASTASTSNDLTPYQDSIERLEAQDRRHASELDSLRDQVDYCRNEANWNRPPCAASGQNSVGTLYTTQRAPRDDDDGDVDVTVDTERDGSPTAPRATPKPTPTKKVQPPSGNDGGERPGNGNGRGRGQTGGGNGQGRD